MFDHTNNEYTHNSHNNRSYAAPGALSAAPLPGPRLESQIMNICMYVCVYIYIYI